MKRYALVAVFGIIFGSLMSQSGDTDFSWKQGDLKDLSVQDFYPNVTDSVFEKKKARTIVYQIAYVVDSISTDSTKEMNRDDIKEACYRWFMFNYITNRSQADYIYSNPEEYEKLWSQELLKFSVSFNHNFRNREYRFFSNVKFHAGDNIAYVSVGQVEYVEIDGYKSSDWKYLEDNLSEYYSGEDEGYHSKLLISFNLALENFFLKFQSEIDEEVQKVVDYSVIR